MSRENAASTPITPSEAAPRPAAPHDAPQGPPRAALVLLGLAFAALAGTGLLLWSVQGPAVFNEVVLAALAWCF